MRTISDRYQKLNYELHKQSADYGGHGDKNATAVLNVARNIGAKSILDYGCGKGRLGEAVRKLAPEIDMREYDPSVPGKTKQPAPADLVVCCDVMEHVEPEYVESVLAHLHSVTGRILMATFATTASTQTLADGRNAHLIVQPAEWWLEKIGVHFEPVEPPSYDTTGFGLIAKPRPT